MNDNEIIAEFMGGRVSMTYGKLTAFKNAEDIKEAKKHGWVANLNYDTSWDSLMSVVEKIETFNFSVMVIGKYTRIQCPHPYKEFATDICETKIQSTYKAVVEFIKWHNGNNL